jgi:hypothetical protein
MDEFNRIQLNLRDLWWTYVTHTCTYHNTPILLLSILKMLTKTVSNKVRTGSDFREKINADVRVPRDV